MQREAAAAIGLDDAAIFGRARADRIIGDRIEPVFADLGLRVHIRIGEHPALLLVDAAIGRVQITG